MAFHRLLIMVYQIGHKRKDIVKASSESHLPRQYHLMITDLITGLRLN